MLESLTLDAIKMIPQLDVSQICQRLWYKRAYVYISASSRTFSAPKTGVGKTTKIPAMIAKFGVAMMLLGLRLTVISAHNHTTTKFYGGLSRFVVTMKRKGATKGNLSTAGLIYATDQSSSRRIRTRPGRFRVLVSGWSIYSRSGNGASVPTISSYSCGKWETAIALHDGSKHHEHNPRQFW